MIAVAWVAMLERGFLRRNEARTWREQAHWGGDADADRQGQHGPLAAHAARRRVAVCDIERVTVSDSARKKAARLRSRNEISLGPVILQSPRGGTEDFKLMQSFRTASPPHSRVRAVFKTSAAFFDMPRGATFEDLADRLHRFGERHDDPLTSIAVAIDIPCARSDRGRRGTLYRRYLKESNHDQRI